MCVGSVAFSLCLSPLRTRSDERFDPFNLDFDAQEIVVHERSLFARRFESCEVVVVVFELAVADAQRAAGDVVVPGSDVA